MIFHLSGASHVSLQMAQWNELIFLVVSCLCIVRQNSLVAILLENIEFVFSKLRTGNKNTNYFLSMSCFLPLTICPCAVVRRQGTCEYRIAKNQVYSFYLNVPSDSICMSQNINIWHISGKWSCDYLFFQAQPLRDALRFGG